MLDRKPCVNPLNRRRAVERLVVVMKALFLISQERLLRQGHNFFLEQGAAVSWVFGDGRVCGSPCTVGQLYQQILGLRDSSVLGSKSVR